MKNKNENQGLATVTFLNRIQIDFLDKLGKDFSFKNGKKLCRNKVLSELVNLLMILDIPFNNVELSNETLAEGILRLIKESYFGQKFTKEQFEPEKERNAQIQEMTTKNLKNL